MNFVEYVEILKNQFMSCLNVNLINWENLKNISWDQQEIISQNVLENKVNKKFPVRNSYQLAFLKNLIEYLELNEIEIHDRIYELYCNFKSKPLEDEKLAYKHYILHKNKVCISLKESKSFVVEGTTGLCSWQASLALSNWLLNNPQILNNKVVLELGAGTGLCSFTALKCCNPKEVMITDGSIKVLNLLDTNLTNNFNEIKLKKSVNNYKSYILKDMKLVSTFLLQWEEIENLKLESFISPKVILAADVVYDNSIFESLSNTIDYIFNYMKHECVMYLAATIRNKETLKEFSKTLESKKINIEQVETASDKIFFYWDNLTPIQIYCVTKCS